MSRLDLNPLFLSGALVNVLDPNAQSCRCEGFLRSMEHWNSSLKHDNLSCSALNQPRYLSAGFTHTGYLHTDKGIRPRNTMTEEG